MGLSINKIIELRTPQFTTDPRLSDLITLAKEITGSEFGDCYNQAVALRVMHWLTLESINGGDSTNSGSGSAGRITSEKEGKLALRRSKSNDTNYDDLSSTQYGTELIALIKGCILSARNRLIPNGITTTST